MATKIDFPTLAQRLFERPKVRARICRDYGLTDDGAPPVEMVGRMVAALGQAPPGEDAAPPTNAAVFQAAARALASNSRAWATFLKNEQRFEDLLCGYDPAETARRLEAGTLTVADIRACLPH